MDFKLRLNQHCAQVSRNDAETRRFDGVSRTQLHSWLQRYRSQDLEGLKIHPRNPGERSPDMVRVSVLRYVSREKVSDSNDIRQAGQDVSRRLRDARTCQARSRGRRSNPQWE
jgi:transposase-like protein